MPLVQQASGLFNGTTFTPTLPGASSASNTVVVCVAGNTTVTTPTNWTLRTSQVNQMGHYWFDRPGVSLSSVAITNATGQGTWWIAEISGGTYDSAAPALSANVATGAATYNTPTLTPTAGTKILLASIGSTSAGGARTVSGWTNSFVEQADLCQTTGATDFPMQGVAILDSVAASGSTGYSTTTTFSNTSIGRSAIIASYSTSAAAAVALTPRRRIVSQAVHRSSNY